ncbi:MAG: hypothetical protein HQ541_23345 [Mariniphaga sp.]|nr:hypothetical protein [Mariniphaga sp.]
MKRFILILFGVLIFSSSVFSQDFRSINDLINETNIRSRGINNNNDYTGSPYENDEFVKGKLITHSEFIYNDIPLRLNIYNNNIEYKDDKGETFAIDNPDYFSLINIGDAKIRYITYELGKKINKAYFKVIEEGKATLLLKPKVNFQEATKPGAYQEAKSASFKRLPDEIYIQVGEKKAQQVTNKKSLLLILSEKQGLINAFLKENKIKLNKSEDILKVVRYYNSI